LKTVREDASQWAGIEITVYQASQIAIAGFTLLQGEST